jgi:hypothetical protein
VRVRGLGNGPSTFVPTNDGRLQGIVNCDRAPSIVTGAFWELRTKAETPLHRAAAFGNEETIKLLLDAGAQIDAKDMNGDSPLTWASWHLRSQTVLRKLCYGGFRA